MRTHRRQFLVVLGATALGLVVGWIFMPSGWKRRVGMLPALFELVHPTTHTFRVSGSVVDEDGRPLERVLLGIGEHTPSATNRPPEQRNTNRWIGRSFDVTSEGYMVLSLYFDKPGYKPAKLDFTRGGEFSKCEVKLVKADAP